MVGAVKTQLAHQRDQLSRKAPLAKALFDDGNYILVDKIAGRAADQEFLFGEARVEMKKIEALKFEGHGRARSLPGSEQFRKYRWVNALTKVFELLLLRL